MKKYLISILFLSFTNSYAGYGDQESGYPNIDERAVHVLTNMARMHPVEFDDTYVGNGILDTYTPAQPMYHDSTLSRLGRYHSEDMAHYGWGVDRPSAHFSSKLQNPADTIYNDDTSIKSIDSLIGWAERMVGMNDSNFTYVTYQNTLAENVAYVYGGSNSRVPIRIVNNWLNSTGHRNTIYRDGFNEFGVGWVANDSVINSDGSVVTWSTEKARFSTQSFGRTEESNLTENPIVSGMGMSSIHTIASANPESWNTSNNDSVSFFVTYSDAGNNPLSADLIVEGNRIPMSLKWGTADYGTYEYISAGVSCENFYFEFKDADSKTWTYPETTYLGTSSECDTGAERGVTLNLSETFANGVFEFKKGMHLSLFTINGQEIFDGILESNGLPKLESSLNKNSVILYVVRDRNESQSGKVILK